MLRFQLGPKLLGAEVLATIARERRSGTLNWGNGSLTLSAGRPVGLDAESAAKEDIIKAVRLFSITADGGCTFELRDVLGTSEVDPLGEILVTVAHKFPAPAIVSFLEARGGRQVRATSKFSKLAALVAKMGGERLSLPTEEKSLREFMGYLDPGPQRAWMVQFLLGGLEWDTAPLGLDELASKDSGSSQLSTDIAFPEEPKSREAAERIVALYKKKSHVTYYQMLDVAPGASPEDIRKAYFAFAKEWHTDRFSAVDLGEAKPLLEDLLQRASEAHDTLSDAEARESYDFVLDREAKGLPTDVGVIMEAEAIFKRAQSLIRRGQVAQAEPFLKQAVEMNRGEADHWAYWGFSLYAAKGKEGAREARTAIQSAIDLDPKADAPWEFLGRIARIEGDLGAAKKNLSKALELNPENQDAARELRLVTQRAQTKDTKGLFSKLLGK